jgi:hypothetical protein
LDSHNPHLLDEKQIPYVVYSGREQLDEEYADAP